IHVAHFNHMFRGAEAEEEALFVENIAFAMGLECTVETHDVPRYLKETGLSPEEGARYLRYDFLNRVAKSINADVISTAHHANDQAETVLLHLLRGAGPEGLAAISPREGMLIRPMLGITKEEILAYCQKNNLEYRWDSSNNESIYTRNR
ncbi:MAG: tRNA lysidine(34) synthetase TilS, partial [Bacillota bacterium]